MPGGEDMRVVRISLSRSPPALTQPLEDQALHLGERIRTAVDRGVFSVPVA
jgi:hypothetical protein